MLARARRCLTSIETLCWRVSLLRFSSATNWFLWTWDSGRGEVFCLSDAIDDSLCRTMISTNNSATVKLCQLHELNPVLARLLLILEETEGGRGVVGESLVLACD